MRAKPAAKPEMGEGLEALLQNTPQLRRVLLQAQERGGSVTFDQLNAALPPDFPLEQIEEFIQLLDARGITVLRDDAAGDIDGEPAEAEPAAGEGERRAEEAAEGEETPATEEDLGRTDDPVRMYLREMGTIELLSREGEIEIAKRIEAGRNTVLEALCESPLTMRAVIGWRDAIREGRVLLRDIIDLEATNDAVPARRGRRREAGRVVAEPLPRRQLAGDAGPEAPVAGAVVRRAAAVAGGRRGRGREDGDEAEDGVAASARGRRTRRRARRARAARGGGFRRGHALALGPGEQAARRRARDLRPDRRGLPRPARPPGGAAEPDPGAPSRSRAQLDKRYQAARHAMVELMQQVSLNQSRVEAAGPAAVRRQQASAEPRGQAAALA